MNKEEQNSKSNLGGGNNPNKVTAYMVYRTMDYDLFVKLEGNRDLRGVKKIKDSIQTVGYIPSPICVNENFEVIDGQNRLEALKELGLPVEYYIAIGTGYAEAINLNLNKSNWTPADYAKSYAQRGNENYRKLLKIHEQFGFISLGDIVAIKNNCISTGGNFAKFINNGTFEINEKQYRGIVEALNFIKGMKEDIMSYTRKKGGEKRMVITALAWMMNVKGADKNRIKTVFQKNYSLLVPPAKTTVFLEDISEYYNKGLAKTKKIHFDSIYKEQQDER